jgi:N utilization substance protein A
MARKASTEIATNANPELIVALDMLEKEKGIKKEIILEAIRASLEAAYKKNFTKDDKNNREVSHEEGVEQEQHKEEITVDIDTITGAVEVFAKKVVVENVEDGSCEISLPQAKMVDEKYELGDIVNVSVTPKDFCRIAAQHARNVIVQKIKEAERQNVYDTFHSKEREVVTGVVQRIETKPYTDREGVEHISTRVIVGLDERTEVALLEKECVPGERFTVGERIKVYIVEVKDSGKGARIMISRTHPELVKRLLEKEVTEIADGTVEIKKVAREAGSRSKISVWAKDPNVDAVGACVGLNGARINAIVSDLKGEKIDVIEWNEDPVVLISNALSPSKVVSTKVCLEDKSARVIVPDYQLSLAIGKRGQNASLAAHLTDYKIDIKSESQADEFEDDGKLYIGKGEYIRYNADGTLKEGMEESLAFEEELLAPEEMTEPEEDFAEIIEEEFEEITEEEFEEIEDLDEEVFEEVEDEE